MANTLICTTGLPRSGKSTWAKQQPYPIVSPDAIRLAIHGSPFIQTAEPFVWATAVTMVRALFLAGTPTVIVDATNGTRKRRADWFDPLWETRWMVFDTPPEVCIERAMAENNPTLADVIRKMHDDWESLAYTCKLWPPPQQAALPAEGPLVGAALANLDGALVLNADGEEFGVAHYHTAGRLVVRPHRGDTLARTSILSVTRDQTAKYNGFTNPKGDAKLLPDGRLQII